MRIARQRLGALIEQFADIVDNRQGIEFAFDAVPQIVNKGSTLLDAEL
jgi:hypothetical protein